MKGNCRKALAALVLVLAFSSAAFADDGVIWPDKTPPPPPTTTAAGTASADGFMHTDVTSTDSVTEAALLLMQLALTRL
jgi:hypothetical protein